MASQQASVEHIYNYGNSPTLINSAGGWGNKLSLVKDSYSGKYYGEVAYKDVVEGIKNATAYYTSLANPKSNGLSIDSSPVQNNMFGNSSPIDDAKKVLETLQAFKIPSESQYVQKPQMLASYEAHPDGWNKYFESSYKNPRLDEANSYLGKDTSQASPLAIAAPQKLSPTTVGTGIASTSPINPFGQLDSGLGV